MEVLPRHIAPWTEELLSVSPVVVIEGARQVGKSTLASLLSSPSATYVTMDDDDILLVAQDDPVGLLRSAGSHRLVIDEIQRCPELILPLKAEVDRDRRPGRFVPTGSANLLRVPGAQDSLAGRAMTIRLHGFSQGELTQEADDWVATVTAGGLGPIPALSRGDLVNPDHRGWLSLCSAAQAAGAGGVADGLRRASS